jgi:hypothetical protein
VQQQDAYSDCSMTLAHAAPIRTCRTISSRRSRMTLRSVRDRSICPPVITAFQATPGQSSETIRLRTIRRSHALSSVVNSAAVMSGDRLRLVLAPAVDLAGCADDECEVLHTCSNCPALPMGTKGAPYRETSQLSEYPRGNAPSFSADQIDAMNRAFRQACARMGLTGSTPVIELVAVRILEIAYGGEFDPDTMAEKVVAEFGA